jgi:hypothetical protein
VVNEPGDGDDDDDGDDGGAGGGGGYYRAYRPARRERSGGRGGRGEDGPATRGVRFLGTERLPRADAVFGPRDVSAPLLFSAVFLAAEVLMETDRGAVAHHRAGGAGAVGGGGAEVSEGGGRVVQSGGH